MSRSSSFTTWCWTGSIVATGRSPTGGGDGIRAGGGLVLVREHLRRLDGRERLLGLVLLHLDVEERRDDLLADDLAELLEHDVALAAVLDERILLGHRPQVHALAEVVHRLEVLAPARVDDLEDHEPLDLAHQLGAEAGLAVVVRVERVLAELLGSATRARGRPLPAALPP